MRFRITYRPRPNVVFIDYSDSLTIKLSPAEAEHMHKALGEALTMARSATHDADRP